MRQDLIVLLAQMDKSENPVPSEVISCPCCHSQIYKAWGEELGFCVVRCAACQLLYVNPRPSQSHIEQSVRTGEHTLGLSKLNVRSRRDSRKIGLYRLVLGKIFGDIFNANAPITWVDVGSGYGELLEVVALLAPKGSEVIGVEPMAHKANSAAERGLAVVNSYLQKGQFKANVISVVDIFSHIPDFHLFLRIAATNLIKNGELFVETGNLADLTRREEFPGELGLPDHLVFAGEKQLLKYLNDAGFDIVSISRVRIDGAINLLKNFAKIVIGRPVKLGVPYTSKYRQLRVRARLRLAD